MVEIDEEHAAHLRMYPGLDPRPDFGCPALGGARVGSAPWPRNHSTSSSSFKTKLNFNKRQTTKTNLSGYKIFSSLTLKEAEYFQRDH